MTLGYVTAHIRQWQGGLPRGLVTGESPLTKCFGAHTKEETF